MHFSEQLTVVMNRGKWLTQAKICQYVPERSFANVEKVKFKIVSRQQQEHKKLINMHMSNIAITEYSIPMIT